MRGILENPSKIKCVQIVGVPEQPPNEGQETDIRLRTESGLIVLTVLRLGKPIKNDTENPRQVFLTFESIESRNKFIRNPRELKGKRRVFVCLWDK